MSAASDDRVDRLYSLPLDEFTAERNALAVELRAAGDRAAADEVKTLRKPTQAAWAVNQLIRAEPELVEALLGAGGELRQAHRQAAAGRGAQQLRSAAEAERQAVDRLLARARDALGSAPGPALTESMRNSLHAASSDDEARELIAAGRLVTELRPIGLGPVPRGGRQQGKAAPDPDREAERRKAEHERRLRDAQAAEAALRREAQAAERALERAEETLSRARETVERASARATDARDRLRAARTELRQAEKRRTRLERPPR